MDRELWKVENYLQFLSARRALLAEAANAFLDSLYAGSVPESKPLASVSKRLREDIPGGFVSEDEERIILECNEWIVKHGLPAGEILYELVLT